MQGGFLLDVVVREGAAIFQLLTGKDQALLVWRDAFLVLDLGFDILDRVGWLDLKERHGIGGNRIRAGRRRQGNRAQKDDKTAEEEREQAADKRTRTRADTDVRICTPTKATVCLPPYGSPHPTHTCAHVT